MTCSVSKTQPESLRGRTSSLEAVWDSTLQKGSSQICRSLSLLLKRYLSSSYQYVFIQIIYKWYSHQPCRSPVCHKTSQGVTGILRSTRPCTKLKPSPLLGFCAVVQLATANVLQHGVWSRQNWTYPLPVYSAREIPGHTWIAIRGMQGTHPMSLHISMVMSLRVYSAIPWIVWKVHPMHAKKQHASTTVLPLS